MPRMQTAKMNRRLRCGYLTPASTWKGEPLLDDDGNQVFTQCAGSKSAHTPTVAVKKKGEDKGKKVTHPAKIKDHEFTDPYTVDVICGGCHERIPPGSMYRYWTPNNRGKVIRCTNCPIPSRSFFTSSEILGMAWDIADQTPPDFETVEDFEDWKSEVAAGIADIVYLIQGKMDNIESGFGHSNIPVYQELEDRMYEYESWQEEVESYQVDLPDDSEYQNPDDDQSDYMEEVREALSDAAYDVLGMCPE